MRTLISFIHFLFAFPQHNKPYLTLLINKELKIKYNAFSFKKCLVLYNTPNVFSAFSNYELEQKKIEVFRCVYKVFRKFFKCKTETFK